VWTEFIGSHNFLQLLGLAATLAVAHNAMLSFWNWKGRKMFLGIWIVTLLPLAFFVWSNSRPLGIDIPRVTPSRMQLASSAAVFRKSVTVFNPNDFPVFDVVVRVGIEQTGVPASSLVINPGKAPLQETNFGDIPVDFLRVNMLGRSISHPTNEYPGLVYLKFGFIPAKQEREFRISGSLKTNSWADLSVVEYNKNLSIENWKSNFIEVRFPTPTTKDAPKGILFPLTNIPFGSVLLTNGVPAFTNLPHLKLALDTPDFGGTNQFNLTNNFIFRENNFSSPSEMTNLLTVPSDIPTSNPTLKLWLVNDSGVDVTNIDVIFTSMAGLGFTTNEFWHENPASSNKTVNPLVFHFDSLPVNRSVEIRPISFADTNNEPAAGFIGICVRADDMPQQLSGFWLAFLPSNILSKPFFSRVSTSVVVTNNNALILMKKLNIFEFK
jgi:hypothetical protein